MFFQRRFSLVFSSRKKWGDRKSRVAAFCSPNDMKYLWSLFQLRMCVAWHFSQQRGRILVLPLNYFEIFGHKNVMLQRPNSEWLKKLHRQKVCIHTESWNGLSETTTCDIHFSSVCTLLASRDHLAHSYASNLDYEQSLFFCEVSRLSQKLKISEMKLMPACRKGLLEWGTRIAATSDL